MKRLIASFAVACGLFTFAAPAFAGPPLLCHPFEIGSARSLPWDGSAGWSHGKADYKLSSLIADTEALLTPATPVVVRMETLRRAALYASTDAQVSKDLLNRLNARVESADRAGHPDALALLDAAYVIEAFRQIASLSSSPEFAGRAAGVRAAAGNADAYTLISRSIATRPTDAGIQFAAALIASDKNRSRYVDHAAKARAGAEQDSLLARNLNHVQ